jgi:F0F1-type ATP synthase beta subunit
MHARVENSVAMAGLPSREARAGNERGTMSTSTELNGFGESESLPANPGTVVSVCGSVVEAQFEHHPPCINSVLRAGTDNKIVIEVLAQSDGRRVRGVALTPTEGLARGTAVEDTGRPLYAPVGRGTLSRMFDVFGNPIDRGGELRDVELRPIHRAPPSLARRVAQSEIFQTGIKIIDILAPLERGGKAGLFGGAGVGKTVLLTEMIHNMRREYFLRHRRALARRRGALSRDERGRRAAEHGDGFWPDE